MLKNVSAVALAAAMLFAAAPARAEDPPVKVQSGAAVKGTQTVVVGAFNVGFIFESVDKTKAAGGLVGAFSGATKAKSLLVGVTPATMQAITDAAFADFKAQLASGGFTVADSAAMFASPEFAKIKLLATPHEAKVMLDKKKDSNGKGSYYKPTALPGMVMIPGDVTAPKPGGMFAGFAALGGMGEIMEQGRVVTAMAMYAKSSGTGVIDVTYLIDFSDVKRPGAFSFGGVKVTSGMSVVDEFSRASIFAPSTKMATLTIKTPIAVEGDFAALDDTTKGKGMETASNVAGAAIGFFSGAGSTFSKARTTTFTAREAYKDGAIKAATLANARVVQQLAALK